MIPSLKMAVVNRFKDGVVVKMLVHGFEVSGLCPTMRLTFTEERGESSALCNSRRRSHGVMSHPEEGPKDRAG